MVWLTHSTLGLLCESEALAGFDDAIAPASTASVFTPWRSDLSQLHFPLFPPQKTSSKFYATYTHSLLPQESVTTHVYSSSNHRGNAHHDSA